MSRASAATLRRASPAGDGFPVTPDSPGDRLAALEAAVAAIQQTLDVQFERIAQMQAQIDLIIAAKERTK